MRVPKPIRDLIDSFSKLPGIGPKTAQRLTFYLLHVPQEELNNLAKAVTDLKAKTKICSICKNVGETDPCEICSDHTRDKSVIAVVESVLDVLALERSGFNGLYHVLHGVISPLNNIGPDDLFIAELLKRLKKGESAKENTDLSALDYLQSDDLSGSSENERSKKSGVSELILATNTNMEGESTSMYISKLVQENKDEIGEIKITRIARGLPVGGDIEYADDITLRRALEGRVNF